MLFWFARGTSSSLDSNGSNKRFYYGWVVMAVCLILITVAYGIRLSFGVFFESLEQNFSWNRALTSSVFSVYMIMGSLFAIVGGWVTDRYGAKIVFVVMAFSSFLGLALTSQVSTLWHIYLSYSLLVAMGTGATYPVATSLAIRWFKERRGLAIAIVTSGVGLGSMLMAPVASYLITGYGWRTSFLAIGIIAFILMIPCSFLLRRTPVESEALPKDGQQKTGSPSPPESRNNEFGGFSITQAIKARNFSLMFFVWFFYAFCLFMVMAHIIRHAIDLNIDPIQAASIISVSGFTNIPARILMGMASDRFGSKRAAFICAVLMAAAMLWLTQSSSLWMLYAFAAVFGAAYGGLAPPTNAIIGDTFEGHNIGAILGILNVGWVSGAAVGPALTGYIFDTTGGYYLAFWFGIVAALIVSVLLIFIKAPIVQSKND